MGEVIRDIEDWFRPGRGRYFEFQERSISPNYREATVDYYLIWPMTDEPATTDVTWLADFLTKRGYPRGRYDYSVRPENFGTAQRGSAMTSRKWPEEMVLRFIDERTTEPIAELVVFVELPTPRKNSFSVGPLTTCAKGEIRLTRSFLRSEIDACEREFPMDYSGTLDDCTGLVIRVEEKEALNTRVRRLREPYPEVARRLSEMAKKGANHHYNSCTTEVRRPFGSGEIVVALKPR